MENKLTELEINTITKEIIQLKNQTAKNIIEIGKRLLIIKKLLNHGEFLQYLENRVDFTQRTAQRFIKVYSEFGDTTTLSYLEPSKLISLTKIPKKDREKFIKDNDIKNMSCRQIEQAIKDIKKTHKLNNKSVSTGRKITTEPLINDIKDNIYNDTQKMLDEIYLRIGDFYNDINSNLDLTDFESLLITRYFNKEVSHSELEEVIKQNKLNIPFIQDEKIYLEYLKDLDITNSYSHLEYVPETKDYIYYYSILEDRELSYDTVVKYSWEDDAELRQKYIKENRYYFEKDDIEISEGWIEDTSYICIYLNEELFAHFKDNTNFRPKIEKLFKVYQLHKKCWMDLVDKYIEQQIKEKQEQEQLNYDRAVKDAKFKFIKGDETYLLKKYYTNRDYIKVFKGTKEVANYVFEEDVNLYSKDFYSIVCTGDFISKLVSDTKKNNIALVHILKFKDALKVKAKTVRDQYTKQKKNSYEKYNYYSGYSSFGFGSNSTKKEVSIDIFTEDELQLLKEIVEDKDLWRKVYTKTAIKVHPDRVANKGQESVKEAENQMKLLNSINDKIQKCC